MRCSESGFPGAIRGRGLPLLLAGASGLGRSDNSRIAPPAGSLTIEDGRRPPCPRTPPSAQMKGTWSPGKPCASLPSGRGHAGSGGRLGLGHLPSNPPLPPRARERHPLPQRGAEPGAGLLLSSGEITHRGPRFSVPIDSLQHWT